MKQSAQAPKNAPKRSPFAMKCTINRTHLQANAGSSVFVAVDLSPSAAAIAARSRSISLAIDSSGSMDGEKMEQAKGAALGLVTQLRQEDMVSIVSFSDTVKGHLAAPRAGDLRRAGAVVANPELKVWMMPGVELAAAYTVRPALNRLPRPKLDGGAFTIPLKDLIPGQEQSLVFRLRVPSRAPGDGP